MFVEMYLRVNVNKKNHEIKSKIVSLQDMPLLSHVGRLFPSRLTRDLWEYLFLYSLIKTVCYQPFEFCLLMGEE